jgi:hypothetical protein
VKIDYQGHKPVFGAAGVLSDTPARPAEENWRQRPILELLPDEPEPEERPIMVEPYNSGFEVGAEGRGILGSGSGQTFLASAPSDFDLGDGSEVRQVPPMGGLRLGRGSTHQQAIYSVGGVDDGEVQTFGPTHGAHDPVGDASRALRVRVAEQDRLIAEQDRRLAALEAALQKSGKAKPRRG